VTPARCRNVKEVGQGFVPKLATEAPVNGGRNYDGPKVSHPASLSKIWLYAGNSEYATLPLARSVTMRWMRTISRKGPKNLATDKITDEHGSMPFNGFSSVCI